MKTFSPDNFRQQFPVLNQSIDNKPLVYADNAATSQKPQIVIEQYQKFYQLNNANVHRASHTLSRRATREFEGSRKKVQQFINARLEKEVIWTKGTTESINLVAHSWGLDNLNTGDEIVLSFAEHHANIVPWQVIAQRTGAVINVLPLTPEGIIDEAQLEIVINEKTKIVCVSHISNVIGKVNPISKIINVAKKYQALTLIDGAQAVAHLDIDVSLLDCDFYVFSAHKMYGPTGVGVLYAKEQHLLAMSPYQSGGEMIKKVSFEKTTFAELPFKFEPGTPNIAGVIAFGAAIDFLAGEDFKLAKDYEQNLLEYAFEQLASIKELTFLVEQKPDIPVFSFMVINHHHHDIAVALDNEAIAIRSGHHCAMPLMQYLNIDGCLRLSLAPYNTKTEVDRVISTLKSILMNHAADNTKIACDEEPNRASHNNEQLFPSQQHIESLFQKAKSWDSKHREIMLLGKSLSSMAVARTPENLVAGCESKAWLTVTEQKDKCFIFQVDSDAKVIRGLLVIVIAAFNNKRAQQIIDFDIEAYFSTLGLLQHLSPSRGNGLKAIVERVYQLVK